MNTYRLKPLSFPWPPLIYGTAIAIAFVLGAVTPLHFQAIHYAISWTIGAALIVMAVSLILWAVKTLSDKKTRKSARRGAAHLVTDGPFRFSRNPIYLGYTMVTMGFGFIIGNVWCLIMAVAAVAVTTAIAVRREEMHLLAQFGTDFERYCRQTRRWI